MSSDNQWTALGPAEIGFQTHGANIRVGADVAGTVVGARATCSSANGHGVHGFGQGVNYAGVTGASTTENGNGIIARAPGGLSAYALWANGGEGLAGRFDGNVRINAGPSGLPSLEVFGRVRVNGPLEITGGKSAVVPLADGSSALMYSLECPDSWLEDFGFGQLSDGAGRVQIDGNFASAIGNEASYHVFLSEYDGNNGLYVTHRSSSGFEVHSTTPGASGEFSYRIVAKRADIPAPRFQMTSPPSGETLDKTMPN